jgi:hypothetical protein
MSRARSQPLWVTALLDKALSPIELRVLLNLLWHQGRNAAAWPTQSTIAEEVGLSVEAVRKITKRLEEAGWLAVTWLGPGRGREHHKEYAVRHPQENPNSGLGIEAKKPQQLYRENPNGRTTKTPTAKPRHRRTQPLTQPGTRCACAYSADFSRVWEIYPRQIGKAEAWAVWVELAPGPELVAQIVAAIEAHTGSEQWARSLAEDGGRFIPALAKFLQKRRWEDSPPAKRDSDGCVDMDSDEAAELIAKAFALGGGR